MNDFEWMQQWYASQCDGDWEHGYGFRIGNIDNPGWYLKLELEDTVLEGEDFIDVMGSRSETDWIQCHVKDGCFHGAGGPMNLGDIIGVLREWVVRVEAQEE